MLKNVTKQVKTARRYLRTTGGIAGNNDLPIATGVAINGVFVASGTIIEVDACDGVALINRNLAVYATEADVAAAGADVVVAPVGTGASWVDV